MKKHYEFSAVARIEVNVEVTADCLEDAYADVERVFFLRYSEYKPNVSFDFVEEIKVGDLND